MASSSSSSLLIPASSSQSWNHDVFLSFRGEDTRKNFVDHLYTALVQQGIHTYKDDETLARGESVGPALLKAIRESQIVVIVFSKNYANSSWCLDELAYIIECMETSGKIVMPIFYDVDPSDVRKLNGKFGEAFAKHELQPTRKVESWREALVKSGNLSGWVTKDFANGHEANCIRNIVGTISSRLSQLNTSDNNDFIGMETRLQDLKSKLEIGSGGVRMVGIWGLGGGGKTTLASVAYMEISHQFEAHCFLENIRDESSKHGLKKLQENLLSRLLKTYVGVGNEIEGKSMIKKRLCHKSVLVVLDDVDDLKQLEALAGSHDWFGEGSRIIITTRDEHLLSRRADMIYEVSLLSHAEAMKLFTRHAYHKDKPIEDYDTLSKEVVSYAHGLPLALEVLGSFLYDKDKDEWKAALARLKCTPDVKVTEKLKISYDGLDPDQKGLFLDIACFFRRQKIDEAMMVLDACSFHPRIGVKVLVQKSLIKVSNGIFDMHDMIEEMAHYIVRGKHPNNPEKHSRIWKVEDIEDFCDDEAAGPLMETEVLALSSSYDDSHPRLVNVLANMKKLRWIDWEGYPASSFPSNFQSTKLGYLKMVEGQQEQLWKGCKRLPNLKILDLSRSEHLIRTPDFEGLPCLERLILTSCKKLEEIHPSIGYHKRLVVVNMEVCNEPKTFPPIISMKKLETLNLKQCSRFQKFPDIQTSMDSLKNLDLGFTDIKIIPTSVGQFCTSLRELNLNRCNLGDGNIPSNFWELSNLQVLNLSQNSFSRLHSSLSRLTGLKFLNLSFCHNLVELPNLPSSIAILQAIHCFSLQSVGNLSNYKHLWKVLLWRNNKLIGSEKVLHSMLQVYAVEDRFMSIALPREKLFSDSKTRSITLQLPRNWYNEFSGFLLSTACGYWVDIVIKQEMYSMDSQLADDDDDHRVEFDKIQESYGYTQVGYIPFASFRHISWWNSADKKKKLTFEISGRDDFKVGLVPKKAGKLAEATIDCFECWDEEFKDAKTFEIKYNSDSSDIEILWKHI